MQVQSLEEFVNFHRDLQFMDQMTMEENTINFELYKFYVEQAEKVSFKRADANKYLLTVNTFVIGLFSISMNFEALAKPLWNYIVPASGALICLAWYLMIKSYSALNSAKFKVIHEMEKSMEFGPFTMEWEFAEQGKGKSYKPISKVEPSIPLIFIGLYACAAIFGIYAV